MNLVLEGLRWSARDFNLEVDARLHGPVIGLFGESGSGKTTLLDLIAGLRATGTGRIVCDGRVYLDTPAGASLPARQREVGYVPQDRALFPHLSVEENILYGARAGEPADHVFSAGHVASVLEVESLLERQPGTLSGGEQQRVAIARALMSRPRLLLLDEPLSGLDDNRKERATVLLRRVLEEFQLPMIYVSHSAREVAGIASEVLVLDQGRVVMQGMPGEVFEEALARELRIRENFPRREGPA